MAEQTPSVALTRSIDADTGGDVPLDDVFEALADARRRRVLRCLRGCDPPVELDYIVRTLADAGTATAERGLKTGLHHRDLPKLDDFGLISYEHESRLVVDCRVEETEPYLDATERMER